MLGLRHARPAACGALISLLLGACSLSPVPDGRRADVLASPQTSGLAPVLSFDLNDPAPGDWLQWGRTYDGHNFSPLAGINRTNAADLAPVWRAELAGGLSMPTPLVQDGVMFLHTSPDTVLALDAATGGELWRFTREPADVAATMKMGLALGKGHVFVPTSDLHVLALDARTGARVWDHEIGLSPPATSRKSFGLRSAPLLVGNTLIQGVTASGAPGGGYIVGLDATTGLEIWRFHTIPRPDEPGGDTWNGLALDRRSGGSVWHQGTYDRELNLVYFGVAPTYDTGPLLTASADADARRDALYTNATLALAPETGKLVWYYQHLSNDQWDLDWAFERQVINLQDGGQRRKIVATVGKMGILDALDAATGAYLFSIDAGTQNIVTAIHPLTGAKTINPERLPDPARTTLICPGPSGARSWPPTSYSAAAGLLFIPVTEWCVRMGSAGYSLMSAPGSALSSADHPDAAADGMMARLQAMDVNTRQLAWRRDQEAPISTSVLATAGGVIFAGDLEPSLKALDDRDGRLLWRIALGSAPSSSIITYAVGDTQYVAVVSGMNNNFVGDLSRRYAAFRDKRGRPPVPPRGLPAVEVFALPAGAVPAGSKN